MLIKSFTDRRDVRKNEVKTTEKPDTLNNHNGVTPNKVNKIIGSICGALMIIITTASFVNSINVTAQQARDTELKSQLYSNVEDIVTLKEVMATVPVMFERVLSDIAEIKIDVKELYDK